ncbi:MAG: hypothetical protein ACE5I1_20105 [bacterium]
MKKLSVCVFLFFLFTLNGCTNRLAPNWFDKIPEDPTTLIVKYKAESDSLQLAIKFAEDGAKKKLTAIVGQQIRDLRTELDKEIKLNEQQDLLYFFNKRVRAIVTANLVKINVKKQHTVNQEGTWHTFIVVEYPLAEANKALVDEFKRNMAMYELISKAQAFVSLEKQVELAFANKE